MAGKYVYMDQIQTDRMHSRWLNMEDIETWTRFLEDEESTRYFPAANFESPAHRARFWIEKQLQRYQSEMYGLQAIISKESGEFIGQCGLLLQEVDGMKELEVGYHFFRKYWGKGLATEMAHEMMQFAEKNKLASSIISIIHTDNLASQKVALKNGLKEDKTTTWNELPVKIFRKNFRSV